MAIDVETLNRDQEKALDCWIHGVAHLRDALGRDLALQMMGTLVLHLYENPTAEAAGAEPAAST